MLKVVSAAVFEYRTILFAILVPSSKVPLITELAPYIILDGETLAVTVVSKVFELAVKVLLV